jgi:glutathione S-transferase
MKLYGFPFSPNTWKVRAVAAQLGLSVEDVFVDLGKGEQRAPEYLKLNPTGRTPTLVHGDFVLWESTAIMQYLASQKPNPLWPNNARTRAEITQWQSWHLQHWGASACNPLTFERFVKGFFNMGPPDATVLAKATDAFNKEAAVLDRHLSARSYLVGSDPTLADFTVVAPLVYAREAGLPLDAYAHVRDWSTRVLDMPAWRDTADLLSVERKTLLAHSG